MNRHNRASIILIALLTGQLSLLMPALGQVQRIWLGHRSHSPDSLVINWETEQRGNSVVYFRIAGGSEDSVVVDEAVRLHHVVIPLQHRDARYYYHVATGSHHSPEYSFKSYPADTLRIAVIANLQRQPSLPGIKGDDVHLLLTAGDNISRLWEACGEGVNSCTIPYSQLIDRYQDIFRSIPFMPALGNHDREIRPRGPAPPEQPVYDIEATAFRRFFELPADEWKWYFDLPMFDVRLIALDLNHTRDLGTTWQSSHSYREQATQFQWYADLVGRSRQSFVITLYNEKHERIRSYEGGRWHELISKGSAAITGYGYFGEHALVDGFSYFDTSISGEGDLYPDPHSQYLISKDNYILLTFIQGIPEMQVELKSLEGEVLHVVNIPARQ